MPQWARRDADYAVENADDDAVTTISRHYGALTVNPDGTYSYVPDADAINALSAGNVTEHSRSRPRMRMMPSARRIHGRNVTGANDTPVLSDGSLGKLTDTAAADISRISPANWPGPMPTPATP